ncbi:LssY C-terminal domain-containing protein [Corynebacterium pygosceleis]|uniref:LssY C-terminal domain-containing protein n=1 Tax=Corynebacterium pygosceleis TaxID=2800406 RepID=A0A9Q4GJQ2_9CORY|nr:LssY C-terminal domain-containing protein [Corynebacterium pygosceleis]MCK7636624.1 LssY C-terminal domain-containing protein [Corynebacterium pygosceleis]MCK7675198.1 LssY C-terminal domain-containing protein [Corynebacterium pygosceleis]MCL0120587.1 LssY C-terminal domain-containing protein [Corynebacterium pygosceleis]MCX7467377.1 LssY C-terminal domain-containing protein [Corynebacterium pygosceleis]
MHGSRTGPGPGKIHTKPTWVAHPGRAVDVFFFIVATLAAVALAVDIFRASFSTRLLHLTLLLPFWAIVAYLVLPRIHTLLTAVYVPDYFIGRARTSDGLLGDPINLALDGSALEIHSAMTDAGWILADDVTLRSSLGIIRSAVFRTSYPHAPVSPLLVFGRTQCLAYQQEVDGNASQRHHVRFWRCPDGWYLPGGVRAQWLAAGTYDRAVGLSLFTLQITHKVDADIDVERDYIVNSLERTGPGIRHRMIENFSTGYHSRNGGGDEVRTDGNLPVIDLTGYTPRTDLDDLPRAVLRAARGYPDISDPTAGAAASPDTDVPAELLYRDEKAEGTARPLSIVAGVLLAVLGVCADIVVDVRTLGQFIGETGLWAAIAFQAVRVITYLGLLHCGWRTWWGSGRARIWLLGFALFNLLVDGAFVELAGDRFGGMATVAAVGANIILLLALSGDSARVWSTRMSGRLREPGSGGASRLPGSTGAPVSFR